MSHRSSSVAPAGLNDTSITGRKDWRMSDNIPSPTPTRAPASARAEALRWVRRKRIFYAILGIYVALSLMGFTIDMADGTESLWFYWPMVGTGIAVAITAVVLLGIGGVFGADWERRQVDQYLEQHRDPGANSGHTERVDAGPVRSGAKSRGG